ncbi:MAG: hypothetical protein WC867_01820 [Candidatus Pacearchaeota archaeon]|jgi:hypothetical protein
MVKIVNLGIEKSNLTREKIASLGNDIYNNPEVKSVLIHVEFKDGSSIRFERDEFEDKIENVVEDDD